MTNENSLIKTSPPSPIVVDRRRGAGFNQTDENTTYLVMTILYTMIHSFLM